ncbi:MAG: dihydropteroate synthase [Nevskiaceae bacterium]|jgi:dihydropteroate synthase|nr:dihydropteroate synthase [Nevskiaceae bacterium]
MHLRCAGRVLDLAQPAVMGVLNITPDSFSDGGHFAAFDAALTQARAMHAAGARIIDVGGESTRPGAAPVSAQQEMDRVLPVIEAITAELDVLISIDTMKPAVMRAAVSAGAGLINDVRALQEPGALQAAHASGAAVCLMHMQGEPRTMQVNPVYADVVREVGQFLHERARACEDAGIAREAIALDPGFGFGKTLAHNLSLLAALPRLAAMGYPLLAGLSRKSMLGKLLGRDVNARLPGSLALATIAVLNGARIVRSHDVAQTLDAVRVAQAVIEAGEGA